MVIWGLHYPYRAWIAVVFLGLISPSATSLADPSLPPTEYSIKAAYLYNFSKFIEWPSSEMGTAPFCVGILGEDPFGKNLEAVFNGKTVQDKPIVIRHINTVAEAARCQIVFISSSEDERLDRLLNDLSETPVLTVGETSRFFQQGGMVGFQVIRHNVRFNINLRAAEEAKLKISSQLLKVANSVHGAPKIAQ